MNYCLGLTGPLSTITVFCENYLEGLVIHQVTYQSIQIITILIQNNVQLKKTLETFPLFHLIPVTPHGDSIEFTSAKVLDIVERINTSSSPDT